MTAAAVQQLPAEAQHQEEESDEDFAYEEVEVLR